MAQANDFSKDIGNIADPVSMGAEAGVRAAIGHAKAITDTISFVGENAIQAYQGKLIADAQNDVLDTTSKMEGYGEKAKAAQKTIQELNSDKTQANWALQNTAVQQMMASGKDPGDFVGPRMLPPEGVADNLKEVAKLKAAASQNIITRQDAMNRIAAITKSAIAQMPGWGAEIRMGVAKYTGQDDPLLHHALHSTAAEDKLTREQKYLADANDRIAKDNGLSSWGEITPEMRSADKQIQQGEQVKKLGEQALAQKNLDDKQNSEAADRYLSGGFYHAQGKLIQDTARWSAENGNADPADAKNFAVLSARQVNLMNIQRSEMIADINARAQKGEIRDPQKYLDKINTYFDNEMKWMTNAEGHNVVQKQWKNSVAQAAAQQADWDIKNSYVVSLGKLGITAPIAQLAMTNPDFANSDIGKSAAGQAIQGVLANPGGAKVLANTNNAIATGTMTWEQAQQQDKIHGTKNASIVWEETKLGIKNMAQGEIKPDQNDAAVGVLNAYSSGLSPTDDQSMKHFGQEGLGNFIEATKKLPQDKQIKVMAPMLDKLQGSAKSVTETMAKLAVSQDATLTLNPTTGLLSVSWGGVGAPGSGSGSTERKALQQQVNNFNNIRVGIDKLQPEFNKASGMTLQDEGSTNSRMWQMYQGSLSRISDQHQADRSQQESDTKALEGGYVDAMTGVMPAPDLRSSDTNDTLKRVGRLQQEAGRQAPLAPGQGDVRKAESTSANVPGNTQGDDVASERFGEVLAPLFEAEGGYVNRKEDHGGETNLGISKKSYPNEDIKAMTKEKATAIYKRDYWDKVHGDELPRGVDQAMFDMAVNQGSDKAVKTLQKVLGLEPDGKWGPKTEAALAGADSELVRLGLLQERLKMYAKNPQLGQNPGWINRIADLLTER